MSSDLLRRAAVKLREHAQAIEVPPMTSGTPWVLEADEEADYTSVVAEVLNVTTVIALDVFSDECGAFIALMHPPVALALAELLDAEADVTNESGELYIECVGVLEALAIARAVLREPEEAK